MATCPSLLTTGVTLGLSPNCSCNGMVGIVEAVLVLLLASVSLAREKLSEELLGTLCSSVMTIGVAKAILSAAWALETSLFVVVSWFVTLSWCLSVTLASSNGLVGTLSSSTIGIDCTGRLGKVISSSSKSSRPPSRLITTRLLLFGLFISLP